MYRLRDSMRMAARLFARLIVRTDAGPIATLEDVADFARTRAAFIAQKKLYGYVKERIGTRYPKMFADDRFVASINIAKLQVFAACLADLTSFCVANATIHESFTDEDRETIARACYRAGIEENAAREVAPAKREGWIDAFDRRLARTDWGATGPGERHFTESAPALVRWAPIADELKRFDNEIVRNSIRFAWVEVRRDFLRRVDPAGVADDWRREA